MGVSHSKNSVPNTDYNNIDVIIRDDCDVSATILWWDNSNLDINKVLYEYTNRYKYVCLCSTHYQHDIPYAVRLHSSEDKYSHSMYGLPDKIVAITVDRVSNINRYQSIGLNYLDDTNSQRITMHRDTNVYDSNGIKILYLRCWEQ